jgi:hypothetical protein
LSFQEFSPNYVISRDSHLPLRSAGPGQGCLTVSLEELSRYLGREAGLDVSVPIATEHMDLSADLKRVADSLGGATAKSPQPSDAKGLQTFNHSKSISPLQF